MPNGVRKTGMAGDRCISTEKKPRSAARNSEKSETTMTLAIMWVAVLFQMPEPHLSGQLVWRAIHYVESTFSTMGNCEAKAQEWAEPGSIRICERIVM